MPTERLIDQLIKAGWEVLESDFDEEAFARWRQSAHDCVAALVEPDHPYLRLFRDHVKEAEPRSALTGEGILCSVREQLAAHSTKPKCSDVLEKGSA
jgi:hypothetical protein